MTVLVQCTFWWPKLEKNCKKYVDACTTCGHNKICWTRAWGLLNFGQAMDNDFNRFHCVASSINMIYCHFPLVVDWLSKMAHFTPIKCTPSAMETACLFIREIVRLHWIPANIVSNHGVQFTSGLWKALCKFLKIELSSSSAYHSQTNGQTERTNQTLEQYFQCFSSFFQDDWVSLLPLAEFAYNNLNLSTSNQSPFFVNYRFLHFFVWFQ